MRTSIRALGAQLFLVAVQAQINSAGVPGSVARQHAQEVLNDAAHHSPCEVSCASIAQILPGAIYLRVEGDFTAHFWDTKQSNLVPACRVEPSSAEEISEILKILVKDQCHFAIRGGGHSRIAGSSNAEGGVTIDLARMNSIDIAADKQSTRIGAGAVWGDVYSELENHDIMVAGGRVADVGVAGLTMGGGLSFFSNRYGWTCDQILEFEIVLPNATISHVNEESDPELYWALRGGGNNFGIVTSFLFQTFPQKPELWRAYVIYSVEHLDDLLDAQYNFVTEQQPKDPDAVSFYPYGWSQEYNMTVLAFLFVHATHSDPDTWPAAFAEFEKIPRIPDVASIGLRKLSDFTVDIKGMNPHGMRSIYKTVTYEASREMDKRIVDHYFDVVAPIKEMNLSFILPFIIFHPTPQGHTTPMSQRGGNPLGLVNSPPLTIMQTGWTWKDASDDEVNIRANKDLFERIEAEGKKLGVLREYKYQNYAWSDQNVFEGYGKENFEKLKRIQKRVDPNGVFARGGLCGGYFKINDVEIAPQKVRDEL